LPPGLGHLIANLTKEVLDTRSWLGATETLWRTAPRGSAVRRSLGQSQLEALHEAAYIRMFGAWENFQEELLVRLLCGSTTPAWPAATRVAGVRRPLTVTAARHQMYNGAAYLLWHNPQKSIARSARLLVSSPVETVLTRHQSRLDHFATIRHRVAHSSSDAIRSFRSTATALSGVEHDGIAGRLLRSPKFDDGLTMRMWIHIISEELIDIADEMLR
jgi:hypothetical protein